MIEIIPTSGWKRFEKIFGSSVRERYRWFLFEFGKKANLLFQKRLGESASKLPGGNVYKKRLALAEVRDKAKRSWFATVMEAQTLEQGEYDADRVILSVASRYSGIAGDPVREILQAFGPWTVETIPFVPKSRTGLVVAKEAEEEKVAEVREANLARGDTVRAKMLELEVPFDPRDVVYQTLNVVPDFASLAKSWEFGSRKGGVPVWRPSLRWLRTTGVKQLQKDKKLLRVWTEANFRYRVVRHLGLRLTSEELKAIQNWQNSLRF